jgi:tetratricopeptide (TPR) repeat protein
VLVVILLAMLAFPFAALVAVERIGVQAPEQSRIMLPPLDRSGAARLTSVPVLSAEGEVARIASSPTRLLDPIAMDAALARAARRLLGAGAPAFLSIVHGRSLLAASAGDAGGGVLSYPRLQALLDGGLARRLRGASATEATDLAGLLMLAGAQRSELVNAAPAAYALLQRARASGDCAPQLDLAVLLSADRSPNEEAVFRAYRDAAARCQGDPTPLYLLGQFHSERSVGGPGEPGADMAAPEHLGRALAAFHEIERTNPGSALGWSGEADAYLRMAYAEAAERPFTARVHLSRALALYSRAERLDPDPGILAGRARVQAALGDPAAAAATQSQAVGQVPGSIALQVRAVDYLERARSFDAAATENAAFLSAPSSRPAGPGLFPSAAIGVSPAITKEDADGPLSLGSASLVPVSFGLRPVDALPRVPMEVALVPLYREFPGVTGIHRWCREWSMRRDLVLAGRAPDALVGMPARFLDARPAVGTCAPADVLTGVARLEAGDLEGARRAVEGSPRLRAYREDPDPATALLADARQNLWRFAGNLPRAAAAAGDWLRSAPRDAMAADRAGEIAYLARDYPAAGARFEEAAGRAHSRIDAANAHLKRGVVLRTQHRRLAVRELAIADEIALGVRADPAVDPDLAAQAAFDVYDSRVEQGASKLASHESAAALDYFESARAAAARLPDAPWLGLARPDALEINESLAALQLRDTSRALSLASAALRHDPNDPTFLQVHGLAQARDGHVGLAVRSYSRSVEVQPLLYRGHNDLGVMLALEGRYPEAMDELRLAVGTNPTYAFGWFNLGVVLEQMGPQHLLQSQGAFARAIQIRRTMNDRQKRLILDARPYYSRLRVQRAHPAWGYTAFEHRAPMWLGTLVFVALVVIMLLRVQATDSRKAAALAAATGSRRDEWTGPVRGSALAQPLMVDARGDGSSGPAGRWLASPWIALPVAVLVLTWPAFRAAGTTTTDYWLLGSGALALALLYVSLRWTAGPTRDRTWLPSVGAGILATAVGFGFTPLPVAERHEGGRAHTLPLLVMVGVAAAFLALARFTGVPIARPFGIMALLMTISMLVPVEPLDGAYTPNAALVLVGGVALGLSLLVGLGLV